MTTGHVPRPRYGVRDWQDWSRPRRCLVRRCVYRRADNGMPVTVLVPTLRGRLAMLRRTWSEV
jgi:hypothetical protein